MSFLHLSPVSAEILKSSLSSMERHIQRLENDIENFPKTDDKKDKFVEKLSISFSCIPLIPILVLSATVAEVESHARHGLAIGRR